MINKRTLKRSGVAALFLVVLASVGMLLAIWMMGSVARSNYEMQDHDVRHTLIF